MNKEELEKYYNESKNLEHKRKILKELIEEKEEIKQKAKVIYRSMTEIVEYWEKYAITSKEKQTPERVNIYRCSVEYTNNTLDALTLLLKYLETREYLIDKIKDEIETENTKITEYTK